MEDFDRNDRLVSPEVNRGETEEMNLRPRTLEEYVGQEKVKENLRIYLEAAKRRGEPVEGAILKANSPSCGSGQIYDGTFSGRLTAGYGCFAELLRRRGIRIISEKEIKNGQF